MKEPINVAGDSGWQKCNYSLYAKALFRIKLKNPSLDNAYYSYRGLSGVIALRIMSGNSGNLFKHDFCIKFSTASSTDTTADVRISDKSTYEMGRASYKVFVKNDGYAYFYFKGINEYDYIKYQIISSEIPMDVESLETEDILMDATEFNNPTASDYEQVATPTDNGEFNILVGTNPNTTRPNGSNEHPLKIRMLTDDVIALIGQVFIKNDIPENPTGNSSSYVAPLPGTLATSFRRVIFGYVTTWMPRNITGTDVSAFSVGTRVVPFLIHNRKIFNLMPLYSGEMVHFNEMIYLSDKLSNY